MIQVSILKPLAIAIFCPLLGGVPTIAGITRALTGKDLSRLGTGNISVSAAFQHGGTGVGILAALSEALKGIAVVLLARFLFPDAPQWELIAIVALIAGRYWISKGAGATNAVWGIAVHDPIATGWVVLFGGIGFAIAPNRRIGRLIPLLLFPLILAWRHPEQWGRIVAAIALSGLLAYLYETVPDDLAFSSRSPDAESPEEFPTNGKNSHIISLDRPLSAADVGQKAATLSELKRSGYPVAAGWVVPQKDDPKSILEFLQPCDRHPLIVRSSAVGEDIESASAAGQYETIADVTDPEALETAIEKCFYSYNKPSAVEYRRDRGIEDAAMSVLIQKQVKGKFSGVAFSRDPVSQQQEAVLVEAVTGSAAKVVSGEATPEDYRVFIHKSDIEAIRERQQNAPAWLLPDEIELDIEGSGQIPEHLIQQVAFLARQVESQFHGIPQDIEWTYDGEKLWLLQARPITTLLPIWTRKIAAEVIPGAIRPLTWSINQPLTCGVWGEIFTLVLGDRAADLDFNKTATLHYSRAYFNASLLGEIFERMGLPPESLEFLTRGSEFTQPPLSSTLQNLPGLLRLLGRELCLERDFQRDDIDCFVPTLEDLDRESDPELSPSQLLNRIDSILSALKQATYYSILVPLSLSLRQSVFQVEDDEIDRTPMPEVASLRSLRKLAQEARNRLESPGEIEESSDSTLERLAEIPEGKEILEQRDRIIDRYGYLSEVANDIAVPTWKEDPQPARELFAQFVSQPPPESEASDKQKLKGKLIQSRVELKGQVTTRYSQLMAHLRSRFLTLEKRWIKAGLIDESGDIFFLRFSEIRQVIAQGDRSLAADLRDIIAERRSHWQDNRQLKTVPQLVYGNEAPPPSSVSAEVSGDRQLQGIGASAGRVEGVIKAIEDWHNVPEIDRETILVVPYTDSGWAPILARSGGLISEVGGRLSHGAIVAREYGIPAVMDIENATDRLHDGQRVRIDGQQGLVEILE